MDKNGITYLTKVGLDISVIPQQLEDINKLAADYSVKIKQAFSEGLSLPEIDTTNIKDSMTKAKKIVEESIEDLSDKSGKTISLPEMKFDNADEAKNVLREILAEYGKIEQIIYKVNANGGLLSASATIADSDGHKIIESFKLQQVAIGEVTEGVQKYQNQWVQTNSVITDNIAKRESQEEKERQQIENQLRLLDQLIKKQQEFSQVQADSKNLKIADQSTELARQLTLIRDKIADTSEYGDAEKLNTDNIIAQTKELEKQAQIVQKNNSSNVSMAQSLLDKIRWTTAFRLTQAAETGIRETIETIKEVEFRVMEITRVLNDSSLDVQVLTQDIFNLAIAYGNTFDNASNMMLRFAQAGYNANESMALLEKTMLAVNTAELSAESATNSLIGIMKQWGLSVNDYGLLIDKINITADNFAVTSQDIVDALLKSSAYAKTSAMTFDELVGTITVLKEATAASGKEIGNAIKSILAYTQRPESLKGFEKLGIKVFADELTGELLPAMEIFANMAEKWHSSNKDMQDILMDAADEAGLFSEELAVLIDSQNDYTQAVENFGQAMDEASDTETRLQANLAAGVYRKNYYISLMENFENIQAVLENMNDAMGYSERENEKYMNTLEAKTTQLRTSLQQLSVTFGESGFMDLAKQAVDAATAIVKVTNSVDGLKSTMGLLLGVFAALKAHDVGKSINNAIIDIKKFGKSAEEAAKATATFGTSVSTVMMGIGAAVAIISAINLGIQAYNQHQQELRDEALKTIDSYKEQTTALENAEKMFKNEFASREKLIEAIKTVNAEYAKELEIIKDVNEVRERGLELISEETLESAKAAFAGIGAEWEKAKAELQKPISVGEMSYKNIEDAIAQLSKRRDELNQKQIEGIELTWAEKISLSYISSSLEKLTKDYDELTSIYEEGLKAQETITKGYEDLQKELQAEVEAAGGSYEFLGKKTDALLGKYKDLGNAQEEETNSVAKAIIAREEEAKATANATQEITLLEKTLNKLKTQYGDLEDHIKGVTEAMGEIKSAYSTLSSAQKEWNEQGFLSIDTLMSLLNLSPEYLQILIDEEGQFNFNTDAIKNLTLAQLNELQIAQQRKFLDLLSTIKSEEDAQRILTGELAKGADTSAKLTEVIRGQINMMMLQGIISEETAYKLKISYGSIQEMINAITEQLNNGLNLGEVFSPPSSSSSKNTKTWFEEQKAAFEEMNRYYDDSADRAIAFYQKMVNSGKLSNKELIEANYQLKQAISEKWNIIVSDYEEMYRLEAINREQLIEGYEEVLRIAELTEKERLSIEKKLRDERRSMIDDEIKEFESLYKYKERTLDEYVDFYETLLENESLTYIETLEYQEKIRNEIQKTLDADISSMEAKLKYNRISIDEIIDYYAELLETAELTAERRMELEEDYYNHVKNRNDGLIKDLEYQLDMAEYQNLSYEEQIELYERIKELVTATKDELESYGLDSLNDDIRELEKNIASINEKQKSLMKSWYKDELSDMEDYIESRIYYAQIGAEGEIDEWKNVLQWMESWYAQGLMDYEDYVEERIRLIRKIVEAERKAVEEMYNNESDRINALIDATNEASSRVIDSLKSEQANHTDSIKQQTQALKDQLSQIKDNASTQMNAIKEAASAQINALKAVEKENDRIRGKEEYYKNRQSTLDDIEYNASRTGIEYRKAEAEARKKLNELDRSYAEKLEDHARQDQISAIEAQRDAQISAIESQRDAQLAAIESQISALEAMNEQYIKNIEARIAQEEAARDQNIEFYKQQLEALEIYKEQALEGINDTYSTLEQKFDDVNQNMILNSESYAEQYYKAYEDNFIKPFSEGTVDGYEHANELIEESAVVHAGNLYNTYDKEFAQKTKESTIIVFDDMFMQLLTMAETNARGMSDMYTTYFIMPLNSHLNQLQSKMLSLQGSLSAAGTTNKNTTNNMLPIYATVNDLTDAELLSKNIIDKLNNGVKNI